MKNLEIDRLKHESNERAEEVARLEEVVDQGKKAIAGHLQKVSVCRGRPCCYYCVDSTDAQDEM